MGICYYIESILGDPSEGAHVVFEDTGRVTIYVGTQSNGQGHETVYAQFLSDQTGIPADRIDVVQRVYGVLRRHRDLARYYTRKNISISLLRAARKRDMEGVLSLYGTDEQRYW